MAQRIQQMPESAMPYARKALPFSSLMRGNGAMNPPGVGLRGPDDGGNFSKSYANAQDQRNAELKMQNVRQNEIARQPQLVAGAQGQARKDIAEISDQQFKDQRYMNNYLSNVIEETSGGGAIKSLAYEPEFAKARNAVAVAQMFAQRTAPEIGQLLVEQKLYA
tara:strand:+ start:3374 stop:3865 length:492 start_codon:yes stop_codon:yes gene_type:complete